MDTLKNCGRCNQAKSTTEYGKHAGRRDGLQSYCKKCQLEYNRTDGKETAKRGHLKWRQENRDKERNRTARWRKTSTKGRAAKKRQKGNARSALASWYVADLIRRSTGLTDVPKTLIDAARAHIMLKRLIKEKRDAN